MERSIQIDETGAIADMIHTENGQTVVEVMAGDPLLRERMARLMARDCARRWLLNTLLPQVGAVERREVIEDLLTWKDETARHAALEILKQAGWPV